MTDAQKKALELHEQWRGKISVEHTCPVSTRKTFRWPIRPALRNPASSSARMSTSVTHTPGAEPRRSGDGSSRPRAGDIGLEAGMPVMEGKCAVQGFRRRGRVPLCIRSKDPDEIVKTVALLAEASAASTLRIFRSRCFEIERKLKECCDIPIFHDDQHGTAVVAPPACSTR